MRIVEVQREDEFRALREPWGNLVAGSGSATIFLTWDWAAAWWPAYGDSRTRSIWLALDEEGTLRGLAPLCRTKTRRYGQTLETLAFLGDGTNDSDYLDFIVQRGYEAEVMEAFIRQWKDEQGTVLLANEIPETSPNLPFLVREAEARNTVAAIADVPCCTVRLPGTWEDYLKILKPRFRTKVRSVLRALEERPEARFGFCEDAAQLERLLPALFDLHARRWAHEGKPGVFGWDRKRRFYAELSPRLVEAGALRFSWMEWNAQIVACQYGFVYGPVYFQLQEGYEPASEHVNPGIGLRAWSMRELIRQGIREYDFLGGIGRHKTDWGAQTKNGKRIALARDTWKNRLFCRGADWEEAARDWAKRRVPASILAASSARRQRQMDGPKGPAGVNREAGELVRKAVAKCYLHLGLPAVARPIRERYQLSVAPKGVWPRITWERREKAFARIFCYHRVNDDNDPFFPAVSTGFFEQQVRFVSRHYRVVSLEEMLRRLEDGPPEALVALTFDDGYQDNYQNAFPVLERYGVPATIFLSTGSIDSGEELWFEKLARALRGTAREHLDLEIDIPRRLWLRSARERLEANKTIIGVLRSLPDDLRRQSLTSITRDLGGETGCTTKDRMLSWEQVRLMRSGGIHFGGHTVTHPFLSKVTPERAAWEVSECKRRIQEQLQTPADYFAYPNGGEEDVAEWNKDLVRRTGYRAALTTIWGINESTTDPMALRRSGPWEKDPAMFAWKLDWYNLANT